MSSHAANGADALGTATRLWATYIGYVKASNEATQAAVWDNQS